ncbi:hypothetical protein BC830DRAFT_730851 [Chytriomyces sp. MP71]|nr:hypothetical protein BC830DRAFT_730851 [Chytriomyces sp. MP71]
MRLSRLSALKITVHFCPPCCALVVVARAYEWAKAKKRGPWTPLGSTSQPIESPMHAEIRILEYEPIIDGLHDRPLGLVVKDTTISRTWISRI